MEFTPVPWDAPLDAYERQAATVLAGFHARDAAIIDAVHHAHPRFLDDTVTWLPRPLSREEIAATPFTIDDARLALARTYSFAGWEALADHVAAVTDTASPTHRFEAAIQAVIDGRRDELARLLTRDAGLVHARSQRRTCHDPSVHGATLLHYLVANGVEGVNQRTPRNAVEIAQLLLAAGADPNATAGLYGGRCSVMSMLVSSGHPSAAGVHVPLVDMLVSFGATVEPAGEGTWRSPLRTALVFGYSDVAQALVRHGAAVEGLDVAAALGREDEVRNALATASPEEVHRALAFAAQLGHVGVVLCLLDAGANPDLYNPEGMHAHATPLHQAALVGHLDVVRVLVERGARLDIRDTLWKGTPLGWAEHGEQENVAAYLRDRGAPR